MTMEISSVENNVRYGIIVRENKHMNKWDDEYMKKIATYIDAVKPIVESLKTSIQNASLGKIAVKTEDIAKAMEMTKESFMPIFQDIRYTLFQEGIVARTGTLRDTGESVLVMREKMEDDTLERINMSKFKDTTISGKDDLWEFISELPDDLTCSELIKIFGFGNFVEKIYFDSGSCEPYAAVQPELYIKLKTGAQISDVIEIFKRMKPEELNYDISTHTINLWFDWLY